MLKNSKVAGEIYISVDTVKSHIQGQYHKLATAHQGEAVHPRRARAADLTTRLCRGTRFAMASAAGSARPKVWAECLRGFCPGRLRPT